MVVAWVELRLGRNLDGWIWDGEFGLLMLFSGKAVCSVQFAS